MSGELLTAARAYLAARLSLLPCALPDKTPLCDTMPRGQWRHLMRQRPEASDLVRWFGDAPALALIAGAVSGHLEILDCDDGALFPAWAAAVDQAAPGLRGRLTIEQTPRGGYHVLYRCGEPVPGPQKLARGMRWSEKEGKDVVTTLWETKGEGGYALVQPSPGYVPVQGALPELPTLTVEERAILLACAQTLHELDAPSADEGPRSAPTADEGDRPGDRYNREADVPALLTVHGWVCTSTRGEASCWRRPGKDKGGASATWNHVPRRLYVFSSNAAPLEADRTYSAFALFALLDCAGDFAAAGQRLVSEGYGTPHGGYPTAPTDADAPGVDPVYAPSRNAPPLAALEDAFAEAADAPAAEEEPPPPDDKTAPPSTRARLRLVGPGEDTRPAIYAGQADLGETIDASWAALRHYNDPPVLYRYAGAMARLEEDTGEQVVRLLTADGMRELLARAARWYGTRPGKEGPVEYDARPPLDVARCLLVSPAMPMPPLLRIARCPTMAPSGRLVATPGYDAETGLFYSPRPGGEVTVPTAPTPDQVQAARDLLLGDLLADFPFVSPADRANCVGLFLLPFVRELIPGSTPLHLIEKPSPGTGASLLFEVLGQLVCGGSPALITEGTQEDEWRKRITSTLSSGPEIVTIDNLRRRLDSSALAAALTAPVWEDRRLGTSDNLRIPVRCLWLATGNNPTVSPEIARRCVSIRLDARVARPFERALSAFLHPHLTAWVQTHRAELLTALLTLVQAWHVAGRPVGLASLGSFERWAAVIGGILQVAEVPGFLENRIRFYARADKETELHSALIAAWWESWGEKAVGVRELYPLLDSADVPLDLGTGSERSQKTRLGALLTGLVDRVFDHPAGALTLREAGKEKKLARYRLQPGGSA
jgi:hypothetical protein